MRLWTGNGNGRRRLRRERNLDQVRYEFTSRKRIHPETAHQNDREHELNKNDPRESGDPLAGANDVRRGHDVPAVT